MSILGYNLSIPVLSIPVNTRGPPARGGAGEGLATSGWRGFGGVGPARGGPRAARLFAHESAGRQARGRRRMRQPSPGPAREAGILARPGRSTDRECAVFWSPDPLNWKAEGSASDGDTRDSRLLSRPPGRPLRFQPGRSGPNAPPPRVGKLPVRARGPPGRRFHTPGRRSAGTRRGRGRAVAACMESLPAFLALSSQSPSGPAGGAPGVYGLGRGAAGPRGATLAARALAELHQPYGATPSRWPGRDHPYVRSCSGIGTD